jgi:membrane-bound lytic murein transglycosylase B
MVGVTGSVRVVVVALVACVGLVVTVAFALVRFGGAAGSAARSDSGFSLVAEPAPAIAGAPAMRTTEISRSGSRRGVDLAWVARTAATAGIPAPALRAYADAELVLNAEQPSCHLRWNTLAGIGWIESQHGTIGGRALGADGRSSRPILGPALDGSAGNAAIRSTPGSAAWHGDRSWEHAVGPLQFLTSTWDRWGADGDGDGVADPRDLDDAALAAGRYLCADGHDLSTDTGWNASVYAYNHDQGYVVNVAAAANTYAARTR